MAQKRAKVSTTIDATSASEFFTQDLEDNPQRWPRIRSRAASPWTSGRAATGPGKRRSASGDTKRAEAGRMNGAQDPLLAAPGLKSKGPAIKAAFAEIRVRIREVRYLKEMRSAANVLDAVEKPKVAVSKTAIKKAIGDGAQVPGADLIVGQKTLVRK